MKNNELFEPISGSASRGLRDLREDRRARYRKKPPQRDALDELISFENAEKKKAQVESSKMPSTSALTKDACKPNVCDASGGHDIIPFDVAHPPSPKVSKGTNVKRSKITPTVKAHEMSSSDISTDVDVRQSGVVSIEREKGSDELYSHSEVESIHLNVKGNTA